MAGGESYKATRRLLVAVLVMLTALLVAVLITGPYADRLSCQRQRRPRVALREFAHAEADFQRAMAKFDASRDQVRYQVTLLGGTYRLNRAELRRWVATHWIDMVGSLKPPDCSGLFPTAH